MFSVLFVVVNATVFAGNVRGKLLAIWLRMDVLRFIDTSWMLIIHIRCTLQFNSLFSRISEFLQVEYRRLTFFPKPWTIRVYSYCFSLWISQLCSRLANSSTQLTVSWIFSSMLAKWWTGEANVYVMWIGFGCDVICGSFHRLCLQLSRYGRRFAIQAELQLRGSLAQECVHLYYASECLNVPRWERNRPSCVKRKGERESTVESISVCSIY